MNKNVTNYKLFCLINLKIFLRLQSYYKLDFKFCNLF